MQSTEYTLKRFTKYGHHIGAYDAYDAHRDFYDDLINDLKRTTDKSLFLETLSKDIKNDEEISEEVKTVTLEIIEAVKEEKAL